MITTLLAYTALNQASSRTEFPLFSEDVNAVKRPIWIAVPDKAVATEFDFVSSAESFEVHCNIPRALPRGAKALWEVWFYKPLKLEGAPVDYREGVLLMQRGCLKPPHPSFGKSEAVFVSSSRKVKKLVINYTENDAVIKIPYDILSRGSKPDDYLARYRPAILPGEFSKLDLMEVPRYFAGFLSDRAQSSQPDLKGFLEMYAPES